MGVVTHSVTCTAVVLWRSVYVGVCAAVSPPPPPRYHQETGRAGRDGLPASCVLFYMYGDALKARHMLQQSALENGTELSVVEANTMALNAMVRAFASHICVCCRVRCVVGCALTGRG